MAVTGVLKDYTEELELGKGVVQGSLGVLPVHSSKPGELIYITYDEALGKKAITVTEVSEGGSVPELRLTNKGAERILILDGEQLVGAKQNRILNTTILVEAHDTLTIPVTCVEQGRWSYAEGKYAGSRDMGGSRHQMVAQERARKAVAVSSNLRAHRRYDGDQGGTWHRLREQMYDIGVESDTAAMEDMYESQEDRLKVFLEALAIDRFDRPESVVGALFTLEGRILGMDTFDKHSTAARAWEKLINSYAIEALRAGKEGQADTGAAREFLESIAAAGMDIFSPPGLGKDVRFQDDAVVGSALVVDDQVVHAYAFNIQGQRDAEAEGPHTTMTGFSTRLRQARHRE
ncbi:MAG: hypothetical protein KKF41_04595 [Actinobacteria bacterium]|nr:hypothetical protein [Actinomycetota bacterium]MBU1943490.1 hypothetical protein [Actinomycetota bacterium]MBU2686847.1 hypothetical protein [Actinomycetota bacterium]